MSAGALDPAALLGLLSSCGVDFVVIGAMAVGVHAEVRSTGDVDVMVPVGDESNMRALAEALRRLDATEIAADQGGVAIHSEDRYPTLMFRTRFGKLDILYRPDGSDAYEAIKRRSVRSTISGRAVRIAGRDDLISMKLAAGRSNDLVDVANLTAGENDSPRRVQLAMRLREDVDHGWARDLARARLEFFDPSARVSVVQGRIVIQAVRRGLSDPQIERWAYALAERLHSAEAVADRSPASFSVSSG